MKSEEAKFLKPLKNYFKSSGNTMVKREVKTQVKTRNTVIDFLVFKRDKDNRILETIGVEIKSDKDSFDRLNRQLPDYYSICDRVYLALENKKAPESLPSFVGILRLEKNELKEIKFAEVVKGPLNFRLRKTKLSDIIEMSNGYSGSETFIESMKKIASLKKKLIFFQVTGNQDIFNNRDFNLINQISQVPQSISR